MSSPLLFIFMSLWVHIVGCLRILGHQTLVQLVLERLVRIRHALSLMDIWMRLQPTPLLYTCSLQSVFSCRYPTGRLGPHNGMIPMCTTTNLVTSFVPNLNKYFSLLIVIVDVSSMPTPIFHYNRPNEFCILIRHTESYSGWVGQEVVLEQLKMWQSFLEPRI